MSSTIRLRRVLCSFTIVSASRYSQSSRARPFERHFRRGLDDRHGRAQLVRRIGHELTLHLRRGREPIEQPIERARELTEFVGRRRARPVASRPIAP